MWRRRLLVAIGALALLITSLLAFLSEQPRVSRANYDRIKVGMSRAQALAILGPANSSELALWKVDISQFEYDASSNWKDDRSDPEPNLPPDAQYWLGDGGAIKVAFAQEQVVQKTWTKRLQPSLADRVKHRLHEWWSDRFVVRE